VEGVHFVNGPWFTVQKTGVWKTLGTFWLSNGTENTRAIIELKLHLEDVSDDVPN